MDKLEQGRRTQSWAKFAKTLKRGSTITWTDLDAWIDGDADAFGKQIRRLAKVLDKADVSIARGEDRSEEYDVPYVFHHSLRGDGALNYERELEQLPRLSRIGEFRMARRYEFLRHRMQLAWTAVGFDEAALREVLLHGPDAAEWPTKAKRSPAKMRRALARLAEVEELRNAFFEGSLYLVMKGVHKYRKLGIDTLDLVQEGNISLFQAAEGFDWRRDVRFKTYAEYWINQAFLKMLYNNVRTVRVPVWVQKTLKKIKDLQAEAVHRTGRELSPSEVGKQLDMSADKVEALLKTQRYAVSLDAEVGGEDGGATVSDLLVDSSVRPVHEQVVDVALPERLAEVLDSLPERERTILELRFGLGGKEPRTLFEVGEILGVSAERVRQLQEAAIRRLKLPKTRERLSQFVGA
ncbi:MAG: hypothetical protein H6832_00645 [Planctomycetes bacterium]|nr:hypothetical protein [Planctomycetota bacterium]MCB9916891.1 hypothetical protein [Planctomycetota bacterium]